MPKVIDLHCDSVYSLAAKKDLRFSTPGCHIDLPRLKSGGVGCQVFAAFVSPDLPWEGAFAFVNEKLDLIDRFARSDTALLPVENAAEIKAAMDKGKIGILAAVENGAAIWNASEKGTLSNLETLRRRGVRIMTLVHCEHHSWAASCTGKGPFPAAAFPAAAAPGGGLTGFGLQVIDAMNSLGMVVDVSHGSEGLFWDALGRSKKPVIASHSCASSLCAAARNLNDEQLKALGDTGGVVGVNFFSAFLSEPFRRRMEGECGDVTGEGEAAVPFTLIADHIDHMVNCAGIDAVALGSDFDGIPSAPEGVTGCDIYPRLETELQNRGYHDGQIEKIFQGNFLRVLEIWDR